MFRAHAKLFTSLQFLSDLLISAGAFVLAYVTRVHLGKAVPPAVDNLLNPTLPPLGSYSWIVYLALGWWSVTAYSLGLYRLSIRRSDSEKIRTVLEISLVLRLF